MFRAVMYLPFNQLSGNPFISNKVKVTRASQVRDNQSKSSLFGFSSEGFVKVVCVCVLRMGMLLKLFSLCIKLGNLKQEKTILIYFYLGKEIVSKEILLSLT